MTSTFSFQDPSQPLEERVADLVSRLTLDEKISQMVHEAPAIERLGIPRYNWWNECLHGVARAGIATVFPQAIGLAATFDTELMGQVATAISDEARAKHHEFARRDVRAIYTGLTFWSPNVNIFRDPRWGRGQETYGEDPYLTARMAVAFVKGLQGQDPRYLKVVATPKHYAVHSGPEPARHRFDARVSERDLRETYLPAFEACVREAAAGSVMGAYNRTNGEACCASPTLLDRILRHEWGFTGYVVSDCWAINDIYVGHRLVETAAEAAALAVKAGCDLECGCAYPALAEAVAQGLIDEATLDRSVKRLFMARFRLGMFDPPAQVPYAQIPFEVNDSPAHRALALRAAREAIVLLKNDANLLPLRKDLQSIAVIGPNADDKTVLLGNYHGTPSQAVAPLEGIRRKVSPATTVYYATGCEIAAGVPRLQSVPSACLHPLAAGGGAGGLTAMYYANADFAGEPALVQVDPGVDFLWRHISPLGGRSTDRFSARWTGTLIAPADGQYQLGATARGSYRLLFDGREILPFATYEHEPFTRTAPVALEAGRPYAVQLDFVNTGHDPRAQLLWGRLRAAQDDATEALRVAAKAEVIVVVLGLSPMLEGEEMPVQIEGFAGGDRTDIALPRPQEELLQQLHALGKPMVLVLLNGSALAVNWADEHVPAIVEAWYPGEEGGTAIADVLFGDYNPGGRLPMTFYRSLDQLPPFDDYRMAGRTYRYLTAEPLYAFGHGLSYSQFAYHDLHVEAADADPDRPIKVSLRVTNTSPRAGDEVVQLYTRYPGSLAERPIMELKGFTRLTLAPGETRSVAFVLTASQLAYWTGEGWTVEPGPIDIMVGSSSADIRLHCPLRLERASLWNNASTLG
ncbi:MAG: glycoside hydrolase family 3 C-terminal domain-containing protein [Chloroflexi bacterium]|nr:glycoside hydrolase family 3 C-terminal domain-containing protein [Chloroflexota bacterium]